MTFELVQFFYSTGAFEAPNKGLTRRGPLSPLQQLQCKARLEVAEIYKGSGLILLCLYSLFCRMSVFVYWSEGSGVLGVHQFW